jgi:hypothetical protein
MFPSPDDLRAAQSRACALRRTQKVRVTEVVFRLREGVDAVTARMRPRVRRSHTMGQMVIGLPPRQF